MPAFRALSPRLAPPWRISSHADGRTGHRSAQCAASKLFPGTAMLLEIVLHTPKWVFAVFVLLLWLGARQLLPGRSGLGRLTAVSIGMTGLSLAGVLTAFGGAPGALLGWSLAAAAAGLAVLWAPLHSGIRYDPAARSFHLPGSAVPLVLMMGIFFTKYAVGVALALHPALHRQPTFAVGIPMLYGAFSGIFAARALRLWKLALRTAAMAPEVRPA
jgi:hypothetical protein